VSGHATWVLAEPQIRAAFASELQMRMGFLELLKVWAWFITGWKAAGHVKPPAPAPEDK
jgi:hypothetical protein